MAKSNSNAVDSVSKISTVESDSGTKTLYGNVFIINNQLLQDQVLVMPGGRISENTVILIDDVLEDLLTGSKNKSNEKKNYFYWPVTMTSIGDDDIENTVDFECPGIQSFQHIPDLENKLKNGTTEWAKFWYAKYRAAQENAKKEIAIQKKVINLPGTEWISQTGETKKIDEIQIQNTALGDIENLLSIF